MKSRYRPGLVVHRFGLVIFGSGSRFFNPCIYTVKTVFETGAWINVDRVNTALVIPD
jgi:hypothetical protein